MKFPFTKTLSAIRTVFIGLCPISASQEPIKELDYFLVSLMLKKESCKLPRPTKMSVIAIYTYGLLEAEDMKCFSVCSLAVNQGTHVQV